MGNKEHEVKHRMDEEQLKEMKEQTKIMRKELWIVGIVGAVLLGTAVAILDGVQLSHQFNLEKPDLRFGNAEYGVYGTSIVIPLENIATASFDASIESIKATIKNKTNSQLIPAYRFMKAENVTKMPNETDKEFIGKLKFLPFYKLVGKEPIYIEVIYNYAAREIAESVPNPSYRTNKLIVEDQNQLNPIGDYEMEIEVTYREIGSDESCTKKVPVTFGFKKNEVPTVPVTGSTSKCT